MGLLSFKDFEVNKEFDLGHFSLSEQEIIDFASNYDPLDYHTNIEVAEKSFFKGLVASGPHPFSIFYKTKWVPLFKDTVMGGLEVTYRFFKPVYVNQKVFGKGKMLDIKVNHEKKYATVQWGFELTNEKGEIYQTITMAVLHTILSK
jgi:acyl dehydratase